MVINDINKINDIKIVNGLICSTIDGSIGVWYDTKEERNDNMNILELWEKRKKQLIVDIYDDIIEEEYENLEVVKEYNQLINTFKINMKQLAEKYNNNDETLLIPTYYNNDYSYELSEDIRVNIEKKYATERDEELIELQQFVEEIRAVLSLSDDKDYQIEVLKNYDILDKKGNLNV